MYVETPLPTYYVSLEFWLMYIQKLNISVWSAHFRILHLLPSFPESFLTSEWSSHNYILSENHFPTFLYLSITCQHRVKILTTDDFLLEQTGVYFFRILFSNLALFQQKSGNFFQQLLWASFEKLKYPAAFSWPLPSTCHHQPLGPNRMETEN